MRDSVKILSMNGEKRVALVTGGAKRVGRAIVQTLADAGFDVVYTTRDQTVAEPPTSTGGRIMPITIDVCDLPQAGDALQESIQQTFGRLDVLVHNASIFDAGDLAHTGIRMIRRMNRIHVEVPILLTKEFAPMLRASKGSVIMMVDSGIDRPAPRYLAYNASKAAMTNLVPALARELAPDVRVNGVAPGAILWPDDMSAADREKFLSRVPLKRAGEPTDAASMVRYLVTEGNYITGQILRVDGGRSVG